MNGKGKSNSQNYELSKGIIYDFIGNLNRLTVLRLITESAAIQ